MTVSRFTTIAISAIALPFAAFAQTATAPAIPAPAPAAAPAAANAPVTRQDIPALVKEALMNDPEMIMQAVQKLREKQQAEAEKKTANAIATNKAGLFNDADSPSVGDEKTADITIVEFFDYHCGYCKHMLPTITQLLKDDKKVRVVFKEFPILSEDSALAARAAIAVNRIAKDKYFAYHTALMKNEGKFEEKSLLEMAQKEGIDSAKLKAEMAKPEVTAVLDKMRKIGEDIGVRGTPAIVLNDHFLPGAAELEDIKVMIANVRAGRKPDDNGKAPAAAAPAAAPVKAN